MKTKVKLLTSKAASALLVTLFLMTILAVSIAGYLTYVQQQSNLGARSQSWNMAMAIAEAGIEEGLEALNSSTTPSSADGWVQNGSMYVLGPRQLLNGVYYVTNDWTDPTKPTITSRAYLNTAWFTSSTRPGYFFAASGVSGNRPTRAVQVTTAKGSMILAAMVAKHTIDMNGNNGLTDSYDSGAPGVKSNPAGLYDPHYASTNGDVASNLGISGAVDTGNFNIHGKVQTGPNGTVTIGPNGSVSGAVTHDANFTFPSTQFPYNSGLCPAGGSIVSAVTTGTNSVTYTNSTTPPPAPGANQTIIAYTNVTYPSSTVYPGPQLNLITNSTTSITGTNRTVVMTSSNLICGTTIYSGNSLPANVCSYSVQGLGNNAKSYSYTVIVGTNVTYSTNLSYTYSTNSTYTWTQILYTYTIYTGIVTYQTNTYDHIICGDYYCPDGLGGNSIITCPSRLVLPNGLDMSGSDTITVAPGGSIAVYSGGTDLTVNGNGVINQSGYAANFIVYAADTVTSMDYKVSGNGAFTGVLIAPNAQATMNGGGNSDTNDFNGAIMVDSVKMNGHFQFHYDEALSRIGKNGRFLITSWKEVP